MEKHDKLNEVQMHEELKLEWTYGFSPACGVHALSPQLLFYVASNVAVLFDITHRKQTLLRSGHNAPITAVAIGSVGNTSNGRIVATADDSERICVWNVHSKCGAHDATASLKHTILHGGNACNSVAISPDGNFIGALLVCSEEFEGEGQLHVLAQRLKVWDLRLNRRRPFASTSKVVTSGGNVNVADGYLHTSLEFSPTPIRSDDGSISELVSNNPSEVCFWKLFGGDEENEEGESESLLKLSVSRPSISKQANALFAPNQFLRTAFLPGSTQVLTSTKSGDIVVWDYLRSIRADLVGNNGSEDRVFVKSIQSVKKGKVVDIRIFENHIVVAGKDEIIFYDFELRLETWFDCSCVGIGQIIGFDVVLPTRKCKSLHGPAIVVATNEKKISLASLSNHSEKYLLFQPLVEVIDDFGVSINFQASGKKFAVAYPTGKIQVWDVLDHSLLLSHSIDIHGHLNVIKYLESPESTNVLAVGTTFGKLYLIGFEDDKHTAQILSSGDNSKVAVINSSSDGKWIAIAKANGHIALYQRCVIGGLPTNADNNSFTSRWKFEYIDRYKCHSADVISLDFFGESTGNEVLVSVAKDNTVVEFDLKKCSVDRGLHLCKKTQSLRRDSSIIACAWLSNGDTMIVANEKQKLKLFQAEKLTHQKTVIAPRATTKSLIRSLHVARNENASSLVFCSFDNGEIGIAKRPLDGNPRRSYTTSAHPKKIVDVEVEHSGKYFLTMGGLESTINLWVVNQTSNDLANVTNDTYDCTVLLGGGGGGSIVEKIKECFDRIAQDCGEVENQMMTIPIEEMISIFRFVGYFPSEEEISNIRNEESKDAYVDQSKVIQIYVNYRAPEKIRTGEIAKAFRILGNEQGVISWSILAPILRSEGEQMSKTELLTCIQTFVGKFVSPDSLGEADMRSFLRLVQPDAPAT